MDKNKNRKIVTWIIVIILIILASIALVSSFQTDELTILPGKDSPTTNVAIEKE